MRDLFPSLLVALLASASWAQGPADIKTALHAGDAGTIWFNSAQPLVNARPTQESSSGTPGFVLVKDKSVVLVGELNFPEGPGPFPAIVIAHGCAGTGRADKAWTPLLHEWGYATFVVDSFRPRGFTSFAMTLGVYALCNASPTSTVRLIYWRLIQRSILSASPSWVLRTVVW